MACNDRQLTQAQREAGFTQNRAAGIVRAVRPFSGQPTVDNLVDYLNREVYPALRASREKLNDVYRQVTDNAPSANPLAYYFSTETAAADPTTGRARLNASPQNTATSLLISQTNARLQDAAAWLDVMAGGATEPLGTLTLFDAIDPSRFLRFDLESMVDNGAYWTLGLTFVESSHDDPFVEGEALVLSFIPAVASSGATVPPGAISPVATDTVIGNITGSTAAPSAVPLADLDSTSITYDATSHTFRRAALTGFAEAVANSNATTSAEPIVTYSASSNMSAERVLTSSTSNTVSTAVAGQIQVQRAAVSGFVDIAANTNTATSAEPLVTYTTTSNASAERVLSNGTNTTISTAVAGQISVTVDDLPLSALADQAANTVVANATASSAAPTAFSVGTNTVLGRVAGNIVAAQLATGQLADAAVTLAKMENRAQSTVIGRAAGAGSGVPQELTAAQVATIVRAAAWTEVEETGAGPFNDYNATATTHVHIMASNAAGVFTGVASAGVAGAMLLITHQGTGYTQLNHNDTNSTNPPDRFFTGRQGKNLRLRDNEYALFIAADQTVGATTAIRWALVSPYFPWAQSDDDATGDIIAYTGADYARIVGGNTTSAVLRGNATFGQVVTGAIADDAVTLAKIQDIGALSVVGNPTNLAANPIDFTATASTGAVLRESSGTLGFGTIATNGLANDSVTDGKLRDSTGLSVIGRSASGTGDPADIVAGADGAVLRRSGTTLGFGTIATAGITDAAVSLAKMADLAQSRIIGRAEGAGTGVPTSLTPTQVVAIIDGENATWTGTHSFTGSTVTVSASGVAELVGVSDVAVGSTGGGLSLGAGASGHIIHSPDVPNGDIIINATSGIAINAHATTPVTSAATGEVAITGTAINATATGDVTITAGDDLTLAATSVVQSTSPFLFAQICRFNAVLSTSISGVTVNDLDVSSVNVVRVTATGAGHLTGMVAGADGQIVHIVLTPSTGDIRLVDESDATSGSNSSAANRFQLPSNTSQALGIRGRATLWYDGTSDRWRMV